jgi:hypothetical protein
MTMGCKKVMMRGRKSKNRRRAEKKVLLAKSGFEMYNAQIANAASPNLEERQSEVY